MLYKVYESVSFAFITALPFVTLHEALNIWVNIIVYYIYMAIIGCMVTYESKASIPLKVVYVVISPLYVPFSLGFHTSKT